MTFALTFLARIEVGETWPWQILWSNKAHFHLSETVNAHNCRIWGSGKPRTFQEIPLLSTKVTFWCGFTARFIIPTFLFLKECTQCPYDRHRNSQEVPKHTRKFYYTPDSTVPVSGFSYLYTRWSTSTH